MDIKIRAEIAGDAQTIEAVTAAAFLNAPHTSHTEQYIVSALRKAGKLALSLVAEADGGVIGHVAISPVSPRNTSNPSRSLQRSRRAASRITRRSTPRPEGDAPDWPYAQLLARGNATREVVTNCNDVCGLYALRRALPCRSR